MYRFDQLSFCALQDQPENEQDFPFISLIKKIASFLRSLIMASTILNFFSSSAEMFFRCFSLSCHNLFLSITKVGSLMLTIPRSLI